MAQYRFGFGFREGSGTFTVNGLSPLQYYEEGTALTIDTVLDPGYVSLTYSVNNGLFFSSTTPYTFTMPSRDVRVLITASGAYAPINGFGLKYFSEFCDLTGQNIRLEIFEDKYGGLSQEKKSAGLAYRFGNFGQNEFDTIIGSSIDFGLYGDRDEYFELLDGGNRKFKVIVKIEALKFWEGYISNSFLTVDEVNIKQVQRFVAVDGLKSLEAIRAVQAYFPSFAGGSAIGSFTSALNQTFTEFRPINTSCSIYEKRMDRTKGLFEQFIVPANAIYEDGEQPQFTGDGGVVLNTSVFITEYLENMLRPFLCRVFLWKNEFYIVSTPELGKLTYTEFKYNTSGVFVSSSTVANNFNLSCKFTDGQRTGKPVFTEFTALLELGVLDRAARGGVYEDSFGINNWFVASATTIGYPGRYVLRNWAYIRATPTNKVNSFPEGSSVALVQYVSSTLGEYGKIWGTTSSAGLSDPAISYIELNTTQTGQNIEIAQDTANQISFKVDFIAEARLGDDKFKPVPLSQNCGIMINIGNNWLSFNGVDAFTWVNTETVMLFPLKDNAKWNTVEIVNITVPENGSVTIRLYEVINVNGTADKYTVGYRNLSLKIQENEAFVTEEIGAKFVTDNTYSIVYPEYETKIGDVDTDNSTTAIKLNLPLQGYPHSKSWSRDGVEEFPLLLILLQEMANVNGKHNPRITATATRDGLNPLEIKPYQSIVYDGGLWMVIAIELDFLTNLWKIEIARLAEIPS